MMYLAIFNLYHPVGTKAISVKMTVLDVSTYSWHCVIFDDGFECSNDCTRV